MLTTINHICSLGMLCQSSQLCKSTKLKLESYPFDWIFSNPENIINILEDDFSSFLNKELYVSVNSSQCRHTLYDHVKYGHMLYTFNHHNPKDNNDHYNYFTRCVERFRKLLSNESNKLFILTFSNLHNDLKYIEDLKKKVIQINDCISTKTKNHYMFVIFHIPHQDKYKVIILDINNIKFVFVYTKSTSGGIFLADQTEEKMLQKLLLDSYSFQIKKLE